MSGQDTSLWYILDKIQKDIDKIDEKWDRHVLTASDMSHAVTTMSSKVQELNKLLTLDNGKPSIVTQIRQVSDDVYAVKTTVNTIRDDLELVRSYVGLKDAKEIRLEKMKNIGKAIGVLGLTVPGILAFITTLLST